SAMLSSLAILGSAKSWHVAELLKASSSNNIRAAVIDWEKIGSLAISQGEKFWPNSLHTADAILVRTMPAGTLEQVISRMDILARLASRGSVVLNNPKALESAIDKYVTTTRLIDAGIPVPPSAIVQSSADLEKCNVQFGGDVVLKPIFGSNGQGLFRLEGDTKPLPPFFSETGVAVAQQYIANDGWDARILVVGTEAFAMRRIAADGEWRTNIARGGKAELFTPPSEWIQLAHAATQAVGAHIAGVDILPSRDGSIWVLEVNAVPGWRALQTVTSKNISAAILSTIRDHCNKNFTEATIH
ncbi:MAG: RimK family alpha-L-glutamate ligase, partial [Pirellulales bacterium]|nr:RimK family alpha-L-glutamate ligase [Pirellulales bacterium]